MNYKRKYGQDAVPCFLIENYGLELASKVMGHKTLGVAVNPMRYYLEKHDLTLPSKSEIMSNVAFIFSEDILSEAKEAIENEMDYLKEEANDENLEKLYERVYFKSLK